MKGKTILATTLILLFSSISFGQTDLLSKDNNPQGKHSLNLELLGRTFIFNSFNYEYTIKDNISLGAGFGVFSVLRGTIMRDNNGQTETGKYFDTGTSQMLYANYFIGRNKHKLLFTAGITNFLNTYRNTYPSETVVQWDSQLEWNAGIGYEYSTNKTFLRATAYCISMPDPTGWFPKYMPWGGLSVGYRFN